MIEDIQMVKPGMMSSCLWIDALDGEAEVIRLSDTMRFGHHQGVTKGLQNLDVLSWCFSSAMAHLRGFQLCMS